MFILIFPDLFHANLDLETLRKQAGNTNKEYDRLLDENYKLEVSYKVEYFVIFFFL
jgi:hypothetical protein